MSHAKYFHSGRHGDLLVAKYDGDTPCEFIVHGVFEVDRRLFYLTPDGSYDPYNSFHTTFANHKLTCHLSPVTPVLTRSLRRDLQSIVQEMSPGCQSIKVGHALFEPKSETDAADDADDAESNGTSPSTSGSSSTLDSATAQTFDIQTCLVSERCQAPLQRLASTHEVIALPAYDHQHELLAPGDYYRKLCGAIVEAHFVLVHHRIKQAKKSAFTAYLRKMIVLRLPVAQWDLQQNFRGGFHSHNDSLDAYRGGHMTVDFFKRNEVSGKPETCHATIHVYKK
ncbi:hypothetical protein PLICRDRAFT_175682 [Plicaturopsis crispa FD-325 SS-3]|nr:hypothetical protein PLICRDRAFT_175682 [Plicaturopsis crispa FD-325 SS-3]